MFEEFESEGAAVEKDPHFDLEGVEHLVNWLDQSELVPILQTVFIVDVEVKAFHEKSEVELLDIHNNGRE